MAIVLQGCESMIRRRKAYYLILRALKMFVILWKTRSKLDERHRKCIRHNLNLYAALQTNNSEEKAKKTFLLFLRSCLSKRQL